MWKNITHYIFAVSCWLCTHNMWVWKCFSFFWIDQLHACKKDYTFDTSTHLWKAYKSSSGTSRQSCIILHLSWKPFGKIVLLLYWKGNKLLFLRDNIITIRADFQQCMESVSEFKINTVTDNYWLIYAAAMVLWPYHMGYYFHSLS